MITVYDEANLKRQLESLEKDEDAFSEGCRNDDIVNWALLTMALYRQTNGGSIPYKELISKFDDLYENRLTMEQRVAISQWEEYSTDKLKSCHTLYSAKTVDSIMSKWIPGHYYEIVE